MKIIMFLLFMLTIITTFAETPKTSEQEKKEVGSGNAVVIEKKMAGENIKNENECTRENSKDSHCKGPEKVKP